MTTTACAAFPRVNYTLDPGQTVVGWEGGGDTDASNRIIYYNIIGGTYTHAVVHQSPPRFGPGDDE